MGKLLLTALAGAAVAGIVYYLIDEEGAKKMMGDIKDAASDAYNKMNDHWGKVETSVSDTVNNIVSNA
ncbi:MAG TPA: hypothetical protein VNS32_13655 [Flavisolibacter sp.]|jgi:hypothetical protein|nr:hypothetical protein [Flavisolibacter sp.]